MMENTYEVILDDKLLYLKQAVDFLNLSNKDIGWSVESMYKKLGHENPSGRGYLAVAIYNKKVIGTASLTKKTALVNGVMVKVAEVGDTYTDPIFRRILKPSNYYQLNTTPESYVNKSMFGRLLTEVRDAALEDGIEIIYGTPNANSFPGYTKHLGFNQTENYKINSYYHYKFGYLIKKIKIKLKLKINNQINNKLKKININLDKEEYDKFIKNIFASNYDFIIHKDYNYIFFRYLSNLDYYIDKYYEGINISCIIIYRLKIINNINYIFIAEILCKDTDKIKYYISGLLKTKYIDAFIIWTDSSSYKKLKLSKMLFIYKNNIPLIIYQFNTIAKALTKAHNFSFGLGCTDNV